VTESPSERGAANALVIAAAGTVGFQLAGKSTRDALLLSTFAVDTLPRMLIAAAVISAVLTIGLTRVISRIGPGRLVPPLFGLSGVLLVAEWGLTAVARPVGAVLFYLHYSGLGAILVSGLWAMVNERFDPWTARRAVGRIPTGASVGGLLGASSPNGSAPARGSARCCRCWPSCICSRDGCSWPDGPRRDTARPASSRHPRRWLAPRPRCSGVRATCADSPVSWH